MIVYGVLAEMALMRFATRYPSAYAKILTAFSESQSIPPGTIEKDIFGKLIEYWDSPEYRDWRIQQAINELTPEERTDLQNLFAP